RRPARATHPSRSPAPSPAASRRWAGRGEGMMAKIIRRTWTTKGPTGKKVKRVAFGYTHMINGTRERRFSSEWLTEADALAGLSARLKEVEAGQLTRPADRSLGELAPEYLHYKADQGKRSLKDDQRIIEHCLLPAFGVNLPVRRVTGAAI